MPSRTTISGGDTAAARSDRRSCSPAASSDVGDDALVHAAPRAARSRTTRSTRSTGTCWAPASVEDDRPSACRCAMQTRRRRTRPRAKRLEHGIEPVDHDRSALSVRAAQHGAPRTRARARGSRPRSPRRVRRQRGAPIDGRHGEVELRTATLPRQRDADRMKQRPAFLPGALLHPVRHGAERLAIDAAARRSPRRARR